MTHSHQEESLYQRIGGEPAVRAAVDRFCQRVLADSDLNGFFNDTSLSALKPINSRSSRRHWVVRVGMMGDPCATRSEGLLSKLGVSEEIIGAVAAEATPLSSRIVNTPASTAAV